MTFRRLGFRWLLFFFLYLVGTMGAAETDHSSLIQGPFSRGEEVTKACLQCHEKQADEMLQSSHWKWKGPPVSIEGKKAGDEEIGKMTLINNFCISIEGGKSPSNREKCSKCHPSYGWKDDSFDFKDKSRMDCLICHARDGNYRKMEGGFPDEKLIKVGKLSLLKAAQSVGKPTRDNCGACHFYGGSGDCVKHGDLETGLFKPSRDLDVHMGGKENMACQTCHITKAHQISGASTFTATHNGRVACEDCHKTPHETSPLKSQLSRHLKTVACETCHVPAFGREQATQMHWDWSEAGKDIEPNEHLGKEDYHKNHGKMGWDMNVVPSYSWYNGKISRYLKGQKIEATDKPLFLSKPIGDIHDPDSRIFPFKVHTGKQPMDSVHGYLLTPSTHKGFWDHYDWTKALTDGAKGSGLEFSGKFEFISTVLYGSIHHEIVPKDKALKCTDCHGEGKRLDWKGLGYSGDPKMVGARKIISKTGKGEAR